MDILIKANQIFRNVVLAMNVKMERNEAVRRVDENN